MLFDLLMQPRGQQGRELAYLQPAGAVVPGTAGELTWDKVDLTKRIIKLEAEDTKTCEPRVVFLCHRAYDILT